MSRTVCIEGTATTRTCASVFPSASSSATGLKKSDRVGGPVRTAITLPDGTTVDPADPEGRRRAREVLAAMDPAEREAYLAQLHGLAAEAARAAAGERIDRLGLGDRAGDRVEKLSLGNQQRVQLAAALVHAPDVLVLEGLPFPEDHVDFTVYLDADEADIERWFVTRFCALCADARADEASFFRPFAGYSEQQATRFAGGDEYAADPDGQAHNGDDGDDAGAGNAVVVLPAVLLSVLRAAVVLRRTRSVLAALMSSPPSSPSP